MIIKVKEFSSENIFCTRLKIVKLSVPVKNTKSAEVCTAAMDVCRKCMYSISGYVFLLLFP